MAQSLTQSLIDGIIIIGWVMMIISPICEDILPRILLTIPGFFYMVIGINLNDKYLYG